MGRDTLDKDAWWFAKLEEDGVLRDEISSIGWAFWPKNQNDEQMGFFDEHLLRKLADEIERRNKPFWDEYNKHMEEEYANGVDPDNLGFDPVEIGENSA